MADLISVIVPTRDRPTELGAALDSVAAQDWPDLEVIVVNDGGAPLEPVVAEHRRSMDLRLLTLTEPRGVAAARNAAFPRARGAYLAFLDDDDVYLPGHLSAAMEVLAGGADAVYATAVVSDRRVERGSARDGDGPESTAPHAFDFPFDPDFLRVLNVVPPTSLVLRASPAVRFDPDLRTHEDWDLWLRLARDHGYRFEHLDRPGVVYHRLPAHATAPDPVAAGTRALTMFHQGYQRMLARWAVPPGSPAELYRRHVLRTYELAFARYATGRTLDSYWYERLVRTLYERYTRGERPEDLTPELSGLLEGAPRA
ncbi:glycosyltransferase family 2 protein [Streptomyces sp. 4N509B]|uniref:glycosyltransferase family 2 protein n=1 Tax=Streptomyces sp. 4N509B TaxID=3457413 RepID=UPI003FD352A6